LVRRGRNFAEQRDTLRAADATYREEIRKTGVYDKIWQACVV
jgi:GMP synthase PP-ATPase subunit